MNQGDDFGASNFLVNSAIDAIPIQAPVTGVAIATTVPQRPQKSTILVLEGKRKTCLRCLLRRAIDATHDASNTAYGLKIQSYRSHCDEVNDQKMFEN